MTWSAVRSPRSAVRFLIPIASDYGSRATGYGRRATDCDQVYLPPGFGRVGSGSAADRIGSHSPTGLIFVSPTGIGSLSV